MSLSTQKQVLRKAMGSRLRQVTKDDIKEQSRAVAERIFLLPEFMKSKSISCYLSIAGEIDTAPLVSEIFALGKTLFVPKINKPAECMDFLQIYNESDLAALPSGVWGIREPDTLYQEQRRQQVLDASCPDLDMILMPGVAFDRSFGRLGHGKGYYDRFLATYVALGKKPPILVALALKEQLLDASVVPVGANDYRPDKIITSIENISKQ